MQQSWNTKYGPRRVKQAPPTLSEAIFAAAGITDDAESQAEIAAELMGLPIDEVRAAVAKAAAIKPDLSRIRPREVTSTFGANNRAVIVERHASRRIVRPRPGQANL